MTAIPAAYGAYKRLVGRFPQIRQLNMFAEATPTRPQNGFVLLARPGLESFATQPAGGRRGIFQRQDAFDSDALVVCGTTVSRLSSSGSLTTLLGASVTGSDRVRAAFGRSDDGYDQMRIATGDALLLVQSDVVAVDTSFGDTGACYDIESLRNFWFGVEPGSDKIFTRIPGDGATWDPLTFTSSEYKPDRTEAIRALGDQVWILDATSCGPWYLSGTTDVILPQAGMTFNYGALSGSRDAAVSDGDTLVFVASDYTVKVTTGGTPVILSDESLSEQLRGADPTTMRAWMITLDQHQFYVLTSNVGTWALDLSTKLIHPWASNGYDYWRADMGCRLAGGAIVALDALGSNIWRLSSTKYTDAGDEIECLWTAVAQVDEGSVSCDSFSITGAVGYGPHEDAGAEPVVSMRYSDDEARTWSRWRERGLGRMGQRTVPIQWNDLGQISGPNGRTFEVRCTADVVRRFADPRVNAP